MTKAKKTNETINFNNEVVIGGTVKRVLVQNDKVTKFILDNTQTTPKGNVSHAFISVCVFEECDLKTGDTVEVKGRLTTSSYKDNFRVDIIADIDDVNLI